MPILPAEPDCHPPDLWDDPASISPKNDALWWCLHTKPRQEKAIARELRTQNVTYYLPQMKKVSRTPQGRKIASVMPLFAGYMFFKGDRNDRLIAMKGNRLVNIIEVTDQESLVRDLHQVQRMLSSGLPVSAEPTIPVGARVRIGNGPLTGMIGTVIRRGNRDQFVAVVQFLGRGAMVDLEDWQVERIND